MPTFETLASFDKDYGLLEPRDRERFRRKVLDELLYDLATGRFRSGLRIKRVRAASGVWEMTWAPDGRATFQYGPEQADGERHIVWRRIGTHDIFRNP